MKTSFLNNLRSLFLVVIGSLVGLVGFAISAAAAAPFTDNFDSYTTGDLTGQGDWTIDGNAYIVLFGDGTIPPVSSPNLVQIYAYGNSIKKNGDALADGQVYISWWNNGGEDAKLLTIKNFAETHYAGNLQVQNSGFSAGGSWVDYDFPDNQWLRMGIEWRSSDYSVRYYLEGYGYTDWAVNSYWASNPSETFCQVNLFVSGGSFFDSISGNVSPVETISGYTPILAPSAPARNTETVVDFDDGFTISGSLQIPTLNTHNYEELIITFMAPSSLVAAQNYVFDLSGLTAGETFNYSATTTVPVTSSGNNFFRVMYSVRGSTYAGSYAINPPISEPLLTFDDTWVKDSAAAAPADLIVAAILPPQDDIEDCGAYSGIDAVVCNLKNFIAGAFLPSNAAINQFNSTMNGFKTKFPMNYAAAITDTLTAIGAGVSDTSGFSFNLYGNSGTVDTTFFTQDLGAGVTLGGTIKLILTFLALVLFLIWGIGYMHRIF